MKRKLNKRRLGAVICVAFASLCVASASYLLLFYNRDAYVRQNTERELADNYIEFLIENAEELEREEGTEDDEWINIALNLGETDRDKTEPETTTRPEKTFDDDIYYERDGVIYTPDYAKGYLFCVLEYPKLSIRRGVYSGTWDEIYFDLDIWMATMARPDYEFGKTHMAIYGHNHTAQNLSFNNLKNAAIGDEFYLYSKKGVYVYEVTNILCEWRPSVTKNYVDNMTIPSDTCYIITCGRDNFLIDGQSTRYRDFLVEGHIKKQYSLTEYAKMIYEEETKWK